MYTGAGWRFSHGPADRRVDLLSPSPTGETWRPERPFALTRESGVRVTGWGATTTHTHTGTTTTLSSSPHSSLSRRPSPPVLGHPHFSYRHSILHPRQPICTQSVDCFILIQHPETALPSPCPGSPPLANATTEPQLASDELTELAV
eukprot:5824278-Prymnesium_polylepis.1